MLGGQAFVLDGSYLCAVMSHRELQFHGFGAQGLGLQGLKTDGFRSFGFGYMIENSPGFGGLTKAWRGTHERKNACP